MIQEKREFACLANLNDDSERVDVGCEGETDNCDNCDTTTTVVKKYVTLSRINSEARKCLMLDVILLVELLLFSQEFLRRH